MRKEEDVKVWLFFERKSSSSKMIWRETVVEDSRISFAKL